MVVEERAGLTAGGHLVETAKFMRSRHRQVCSNALRITALQVVHSQLSQGLRDRRATNQIPKRANVIHV